MFVSKKELEAIKARIESMTKDIKGLKQALEAQKKTNKKQSELNKKYDEQLGKKYLSDTFAPSSKEEFDSLIDEWQNGAKEDNK